MPKTQAQRHCFCFGKLAPGRTGTDYTVLCDFLIGLGNVPNANLIDFRGYEVTETGIVCATDSQRFDIGNLEDSALSVEIKFPNSSLKQTAAQSPP